MPQSVQTLGRLNNMRFRRTSILRQCSAPLFPYDDSPVSPTSPTEKKNVRFADSIGGQLESVKYYAISPQPVRRLLSSRVAPFLYSQLYGSGKADNDVIDNDNGYGNGRRCSLIAFNFANPSLRADFADRLHRQSVLLHSVSTAECTVYGIVAVRNHSFIKKVFVRYTCNDWRSYVEVVANYMLGSHEGSTDKFSFAIYCKPNEFTNALSPMMASKTTTGPLLPTPSFHPRLYFVCRYQTGDGREFWDNNDGHNYCFNFLASDYVCNLNTRPGA